MGKKEPRIVDLEMIRHHSTEKAVLVSLTGDEKSAVWLPLSAIEIDNERGRKIDVQVPFDLAFERGLV